MVSPAVEGLLADGASEETLIISKKKLEELLARLQHRIEEQDKEIERLRHLLELQEGRRSPPPPWVKPNVKKEGEESSHKRGAKNGHEAHHRPPPEQIDETREAELNAYPDCGGPLEGPFEWDEHTVESVIPGHVRITKWRIGRYRCRGCKKIRRAHIPNHVAPPKSNFSWGTHFLVGYWSLKGLTTSMLRDLLSSDYGLKVSVGEIDKMLARSARLFAPAYEAIRRALKEGKQVNADWTGWRVDGVNYNLWDFISPDVKAAFFRVDKSADHEVPEGVLGKRRPKGQVLNCDGGVAFNAVHGKKQRCWVHPTEGEAGAGGMGTPLRCPGLARSAGDGETVPADLGGGQVAHRGREGPGGQAVDGGGPPVVESDAGGHGGPDPPEVREQALGRAVVVGGDGCGCPQQHRRTRPPSSHRRETEVVLGIPHEEGGGPHRLAGQRDPDGTATGDRLPRAWDSSAEGGDPVPVWPGSSSPQVNPELVGIDGSA